MTRHGKSSDKSSRRSSHKSSHRSGGNSHRSSHQSHESESQGQDTTTGCTIDDLAQDLSENLVLNAGAAPTESSSYSQPTQGDRMSHPALALRQGSNVDMTRKDRLEIRLAFRPKAPYDRSDNVPVSDRYVDPRGDPVWRLEMLTQLDGSGLPEEDMWDLAARQTWAQGQLWLIDNAQADTPEEADQVLVDRLRCMASSLYQGDHLTRNACRSLLFRSTGSTDPAIELAILGKEAPTESEYKQARRIVEKTVRNWRTKGLPPRAITRAIQCHTETFYANDASYPENEDNPDIKYPLEMGVLTHARISNWPTMRKILEAHDFLHGDPPEHFSSFDWLCPCSCSDGLAQDGNAAA